MRVKILKSCGASGYKCKAGEVVEISDEDAQTLIRMGKAEQAPKPGRPKKTEGK